MNKQYVLTAAQMKTADEETIESLGIAQDVLMERAALSVVAKIKEYDSKRILCICGTGNNGGDALAVARILLMEGRKADVYLCGLPERFKEAVRKQYNIFCKVGGITVTDMNFAEYDMIVDGILGIGTERTVSDSYVKVIDAVNDARELGSKVIAVDIPTGIHTDTGKIMGKAVKADETVTFAYYKQGQLLYPGAEYCGNITVADIGISCQYVYSEQELKGFTLNKTDSVTLPKRCEGGHKGSFGRVLVVAGSSAMYGACYLSALAALRMGVGLVDIYTHEINRVAVQTMLPEAILHTYGDTVDKTELCKLADASDCVVIGPGLSVQDTSVDIVSAILECDNKTIVADADALNVIAIRKESLMPKCRALKKRMIITPHPKELSGLSGKTIVELKADYAESVRNFADENHMIVVGKDAGTVVSDGISVYINQTGNDGMATAGSGDVLSGIIGALCARGEDGFAAAWKGVFLHGKAGDCALYSSNRNSLIAGDIANALNTVLKEDGF